MNNNTKTARNKAVIYARYSSHNQTEQSIEGQLHDAYDFAQRENLVVIGEYIDRAISGTKDDRPDFQRMIRDAEKKQFDIVLVWKLDRFARNRYDAAMYRAALKKHGIRIVSVMENISDNPEGIILEGLLESLAEYYSANLAENVKRGLRESREKGIWTYGLPPIGYKLQDKRLVIDPETAPLAKLIFQKYIELKNLQHVADYLNHQGYHTRDGSYFRAYSIRRLILNTTFIGQKNGIQICEPLIDQTTWDEVQRIYNKNRFAPAAYKAPQPFILSGKLFCGTCGYKLYGHTVRQHWYYYYDKGCHQMHKKQELEDTVLQQTLDFLGSADNAQTIARKVSEYAAGDPDQDQIQAIQDSIKKIDQEISAYIDSIPRVSDQIRTKLLDQIASLEARKAEQEKALAAIQENTAPEITEQAVLAWLQHLGQLDYTNVEDRIRLFDTFVNSVWYYPDKIVTFFNIQGTQPPIDLHTQACACASKSIMDGIVFLGGIVGVVRFVSIK